MARPAVTEPPGELMYSEMSRWETESPLANMNRHDLQTPALVVDAEGLEGNLATMAKALPGARLRPHVKAHKCTSLAARQAEHGHRSFTCATIREVEVMAAEGL